MIYSILFAALIYTIQGGIVGLPTCTKTDLTKCQVLLDALTGSISPEESAQCVEGTCTVTCSADYGGKQDSCDAASTLAGLSTAEALWCDKSRSIPVCLPPIAATVPATTKDTSSATTRDASSATTKDTASGTTNSGGPASGTTGSGSSCSISDVKACTCTRSTTDTDCKNLQLAVGTFASVVCDGDNHQCTMSCQKAEDCSMLSTYAQISTTCDAGFCREVPTTTSKPDTTGSVGETTKVTKTETTSVVTRLTIATGSATETTATATETTASATKATGSVVTTVAGDCSFTNFRACTCSDGKTDNCVALQSGVTAYGVTVKCDYERGACTRTCPAGDSDCNLINSFADIVTTCEDVANEKLCRETVTTSEPGTTKTTNGDTTQTKATVDSGTTDTANTGGTADTTDAGDTSGTGSTGSTEAETTAYNCKEKRYPFDRECTDDPGQDATECALKVGVEMNVCVLTQLFTTERVQAIVKNTVNDIVESLDLASLSCPIGFYYPYQLIGARNDAITEEEAETRVGRNPSAADDSCPKPDTECPADLAFFTSCGVALRCANCEALEKLRDAILSSIADASIDVDFNSKALQKSKDEDTECAVGFGKIQVAKITVALYKDGEETTTVIDISSSNGAVAKQWMVGIITVLAGFALLY